MVEMEHVLETQTEPARLGAVRIGVRFEPDWRPEELPSFARWAEQAGYDELWFSEDLPWAGGLTMAATALASTTALRVGIGLLPAVTRNVPTAAMEIAALACIAPGRLVIGLGHGVRAWMEQIGARTSLRVVCLEEVALTLRRLLAGEEVTFAGRHVRLDRVRLGHLPADPPPILLGTASPSSLAVAARISDGVILPEVSSPAAIRWVRAQMRATGSAGSTVVLAMVSVDDHRERALAQTRSKIQRIVDFQIFPRLTEIAGLGLNGSSEMPDAMLQSVAATGTPTDCAKAVTNWADAGATTVVLVAGDQQPHHSYDRFAREVLPLVRRSRVSSV
jgi:alkanesulfonate monooxygenase SsuD/methylene tetrahydromethanopterin reductase-like flavin-dependent oxidoreductase (luciferase family)